jgi:glutathione synthase
MDPIENINIKKDTTFAFMIECQRRSWTIEYCLQTQLGAGQHGAWATATPVTVQQVVGGHATKSEPVRRPLSEYGAIFMRTDPPVDMNYVYTTHLLEQLDPAQTVVVNRPAGLRAANEKTFILNFPEVIPRTIVTRESGDIHEFLAQNGGRGIIKPLDRMGGSGIFMLRDDDPNLGSILETATDNGDELVMIQEYLPAAKEGDKRILLINGEPLGAVLRVPKGLDFRGNMAVGGEAVACPIDDADQAIIACVRDRIREEGLFFVGLDVIGGRLTEVNVTSPTGVQEVNRLHGLQVERHVMDWLDAARHDR